MILMCSAAHELDTAKWSFVPGWSECKKPNDRCGQLISYSIINGSSYCSRILKEVGNLKEALMAVRQLGSKAVSPSRAVRTAIACRYGVKKWTDIPLLHRKQLLLAYQESANKTLLT